MVVRDAEAQLVETMETESKTVHLVSGEGQEGQETALIPGNRSLRDICNHVVHVCSQCLAYIRMLGYLLELFRLVCPYFCRATCTRWQESQLARYMHTDMCTYTRICTHTYVEGVWGTHRAH